jgi:hypothetical protein
MTSAMASSVAIDQTMRRTLTERMLSKCRVPRAVVAAEHR